MLPPGIPWCGVVDSYCRSCLLYAPEVKKPVQDNSTVYFKTCGLIKQYLLYNLFTLGKSSLHLWCIFDSVQVGSNLRTGLCWVNFVLMYVVDLLEVNNSDYYEAKILKRKIYILSCTNYQSAVENCV